MPREAPYNRLKRITRSWIYDNVFIRNKKDFWILDLEKNTYDFKELRYKIDTANDLGYVVELSVDNKGRVVFSYAKKLPEKLPYELQR